MGEITILHARESREFACAMAAALAAEGHSVQRHDADAPSQAGSPTADVVIVVWSQGAIANAPMVEAARKALARRVLVPVAIGDVPPPASFAHLWPIDLAGWNGDREDPRWEFVRDEISLAMRRNEFAPAAPSGERAPRGRAALPRFPAAIAFAGLVGLGVLAAIAAYGAIVVAHRHQPALRAGAPTLASVTAQQPEDKIEAERPVYAEETSAASAGGESGSGAPPAAETVSAARSGAADAAPSGAEISSPPEHGGAVAEAGEPVAGEDAQTQSAERPAASAEVDEAKRDENVGVLVNPPPQETPAPLPPRPADNYAGVVFRDCVDCPDMAEIRPVPALAGDGIERASRPAIEAPFAISRREITFKQWDACVRDGGCRAYSPSDEAWGRGDRPVINVSYEDAQSYVAWLTRKTGRRYRLPSAAEWAYAAHAGAPGPYSFGALGVSKANYDGGPGARRMKTVPVGSFPPSVYGLYDMNGNVGEWTGDCARMNSRGACAERIVMGGAWDSPASAITADSRAARNESHRAPDIGFRVARDAS